MEIETILISLLTFLVLLLGALVCGAIGSSQPHKGRSEQSNIDERQAITDETIAAMRAGTFYGNGKQIVEDARKPFRNNL